MRFGHLVYLLLADLVFFFPVLTSLSFIFWTWLHYAPEKWLDYPHFLLEYTKISVAMEAAGDILHSYSLTLFWLLK